MIARALNIAIFLFLLSYLVFSQTLTQYTVASTSTTLPTHRVLSVAIDYQGNKWFGTTSGVSRFDGLNWTSYSVEDGLAHNAVRAIAPDSNGNIWFGTPAGVSKFDGQNWHTYTSSEGLSTKYIYHTVVDSTGNVWIGNARGVSRFDGENWTTFTREDGLVDTHIQTLVLGPDGDIWAGTSEGVSRYNGEAWTSYTSEDGLAHNYVEAIAVDPSGTLWFITYGGLSKYDGKSWNSFEMDDGLKNGVDHAVAVDKEGALWIAASSGWISKFDGVDWTNYSSRDVGLISVGNYLNALDIDHDGVIWVGTDLGLESYDNNTWTTITPNGLAGNNISSISMDDQGNIWLCSDHGVSRFDGAGWANFPLHGLAVTASAFGNGNLWFARSIYAEAPSLTFLIKFDGEDWHYYTVTYGLYDTENLSKIMEGENWINYTTPDSPWLEYYKFAIDQNGSLWFRQNDVLYKFDEEKWTKFTGGIGADDWGTSAIAVDFKNNIWMGGYGEGVSKFDGEGWINYSISCCNVSYTSVTSIAIDHEGNLWFAFYDGKNQGRGGVSKFDGEYWTTYKESDGLVSNEISDITVDSKGNIWFAAMYEGGVSKFDGENWKTYMVSEVEGGSPEISSLAVDEDDNIWIGMKGSGVICLEEFRSTSVLNKKSGMNNGNFTMYPNPVNNTLTIEMDDTGRNTIVISTLNGQRILNQYSDGNSCQLDLSSFKSGVYFITIRSKDSVTTRKIVKL